MRLSPVGLAVEELDTPALLIDQKSFDHNVRQMAGCFEKQGIQWRPHAKAFKCPAIAHQLRRAGAIGVTVAKVSEAEVMVAGGIDDILIAHLVVGRTKTARLAALQRHADVKVTVDHFDHIGPLSDAAHSAGVTIGVLVDLDIGMHRTGVADGPSAVRLAEAVASSRGLRFDGVMGYEGHTLAIADPDQKKSAIQTAIAQLVATRDSIERAGLECRVVSTGGTGSYQTTSEVAGITEVQAGGGIFACQYYTKTCRVAGHQPAISVYATVVSRPSAHRAILDVGQKSVSQHTTPPVLRDYPDYSIVSLSAEHAKIESAQPIQLRIGEKVHVVPGYSDFTFVLHDRVLMIDAGKVTADWSILGRGCLQ